MGNKAQEILSDFKDYCKVDGEISDFGNYFCFEPKDTFNDPFMVNCDLIGNIEFVQLVYPDKVNLTRDYDIIYKCDSILELKRIYNVVRKAHIFKW